MLPLVLFGAATAVWFSLPPSSQPPFSLNAIEPAGGSAHDADDGPAKQTAYNGKNLSGEPELPTIFIGNLKVESAKAQKTALTQFLTPKALATPADEALLNRTFNFTPYAHNPTRGTPSAAITVVEFTDLACNQCFDYLTKADQAIQVNEKDMRQTSIHLPLNRYNDTNLAAFYGKIAQQQGRFWEYRQALIQAPPKDSKSLLKVLLASGVAERDARQSLLANARQFYRELDADNQLAKSLGLSKPPHFYVNGISVGEAGIEREKIADVIAFTLAKQRQFQP